MARVKIADLLPGTDYVVQVRARRDGLNSKWSEKFTFVTTDNDKQPAAPTATWNSVGDAYVATWTPVTQNTDGGDIRIASYELEFVAAGITKIISKAPQTGANMTYTLSYEENAAMFNGARSTVTFRVRAVSNKGNKGVWSTLLSAGNTPPAAPTGFTAVGVDSGIELSWNANTEEDLVGYIVFFDTDSSVPLTDLAKVYSGNGTRVTYHTSTFSQHWFVLVAVDKMGGWSAPATATATPVSPFVVDTTPAPVPGALAGSMTNNTNGVGAIASLTWTLTDPGDLAGFYIRYRKVGDTQWMQTPFQKEDRAGIIAVPAAFSAYEFQIRSVDTSANYSAWSSTTTLNAASNTPPSNVTGLVSTAGKDNITYYWNAVGDSDLKNYEVTVSTSATFASGNLTFFTGTAATLAVGGLLPNTTYYARVRAVDQAGLTSAAWSATDTETTGTFPTTPLSDGVAPGAPTAPNVMSGLGYLYATWSPVTLNASGAAQNDPVTYEVHLSTTSGFTPAAGTKVTEVAGTFALIDVLPGTTNPLAYGTTYYIKLIAKDRDGANATASGQGSAQISKVAATDSTITPADIGAPTISQFNTAVKTYANEYYLSTSESTQTGGTWSTTAPTRTPGTYIWTRTTVTYQDNTSTTTSPALMTGNTGAQGNPGAPAPIVNLTATSQVLTSPATGGATTPATTTVTGTATNTTITQWDYSVDGAAFSATVPAGVSRTGNVVTITGSTMTAKTIAVRMRDAAGVGDTLTVAKVLDGAAGGAGAAGQDGYTVLLTNEAQVFVGDTDSAVAGSATSNVVAYEGGTQIAATIGTITGQVTGLTTAITNNGTTNAGFTVTVTTALVATSGTLTIPITADGKSFTKTFSWSVTREGAAGAAGVGITSVTPYFAQVATGVTPTQPPTGTVTPAAPWTTTEPAYAPNTELWRTEKILYTSGTINYTTQSKVSAYTAAVQAKVTADGKNTIIHSNGVPGTTANVAGDTWVQVDDFTNNRIIAQFRGTGGTGWAQETIRSEFIAYLDAQKISAGSTFTNDLNVKSTFTLGDATTPGIIKSHDYHQTNKTGFSLGSNGLEIWNGKVSAAVLEAGTTITANLGVTGVLTIGTGGSIQSSVFNSTTGFKIGAAGVELNDANSTVKADAIKAGVLGGSGGSGVIQIAAGTSLVFNGGYLKSTTNTGTSMATAEASGAGFYLGDDGLFIGGGANGGRVKANALITDTLTSTTITLGTGGVITGPGFTLSSSGINVTSGTIAAAAITITSAFSNSVMGNVTTIDGGKITTGSIQSQVTGLSGQPLWVLNTQGYMTVQGLTVRGASVVGISGTTDASTYIQSGNYSSTVGWRIDGSGNAILNQATVRGTISSGTANRVEILTIDNPFEGTVNGSSNWGMINFYPDAGSGLQPASIYSHFDGSYGQLNLQSPYTTVGKVARLMLQTAGTSVTTAKLVADTVELAGNNIYLTSTNSSQYDMNLYQTNILSIRQAGNGNGANRLNINLGGFFESKLSAKRLDAGGNVIDNKLVVEGQDVLFKPAQGEVLFTGGSNVLGRVSANSSTGAALVFEGQRALLTGWLYNDTTPSAAAVNKVLHVGELKYWVAAPSSGSDRSLKDNIEDFTDGINVIKQLQPKTFVYKEGDGTKQYGLIAQDVEEFLPEAVTYMDEEKPEESVLGLRYQDLHNINLAATKELIEKNEALEARVAALEALVQSLAKKKA